MKLLRWLVLLTGLAPLPALSQGPDPVYGLGVCTSGTYHINPGVVVPTPGPGGTRCVPAANDPGGYGFPGRAEEAFPGWVHGDPAGEAVTRLPGSRPVPGKRPGRCAGLPRSHRMPPESSPNKAPGLSRKWSAGQGVHCEIRKLMGLLWVENTNNGAGTR